MAANPITSTDAAKGYLDSLDTLLGSGAKMVFYAGAVPADVNATAGTVLATLTAAGQMFAASAGTAGYATATMDLLAPLSGTVGTGGTAAYYRLTTSGGTAHWQDTVGLLASGEGLNLTNNVLVATEGIDVTALTLTQPTGE